jgi:hypothetical protein
MKKIIGCIMAVCLVGILTGCATPYQGSVFTDVKLASHHLQYPIDAANGEKTGESSCIGILGLIATGDASVGAAMKQGGITKIHHVDYGYTSVLFIFAKHTTTVYGQ